MAHPVAFEPRFKRRLKKKTAAQQAAVFECIERVAENPWGHQGGLQTKPLSAAGERVFYSRVDDSNRVSFHFDGPMIVFRNHCHKDNILRSP